MNVGDYLLQHRRRIAIALLGLLVAVLVVLRYPFPRFLLALALAELPFAAGAVYLGKGFLERNYVMMFLLGLAGILLIVGALAAWHHRQRQVE